MEKHLGRKLKKEEIVHHKDNNKINNDINNLQLLASAGAHKKMHPDIGIDTRFGE